jgi:hypothetical protein
MQGQTRSSACALRDHQPPSTPTGCPSRSRSPERRGEVLLGAFAGSRIRESDRERAGGPALAMKL